MHQSLESVTEAAQSANLLQSNIRQAITACSTDPILALMLTDLLEPTCKLSHRLDLIQTLMEEPETKTHTSSQNGDDEFYELARAGVKLALQNSFNKLKDELASSTIKWKQEGMHHDAFFCCDRDDPCHFRIHIHQNSYRRWVMFLQASISGELLIPHFQFPADTSLEDVKSNSVRMAREYFNLAEGKICKV